MQHLDEGTIHSWLDGALSADEAARAKAHVEECPQCAAAVAEARGFIAGSSRILTALDNAPRGVIPAAAPRKRVDPIVWRVAATVLVVAAGTLVVVRNSGKNDSLASAAADSATLSTEKTAVAVPQVLASKPVATQRLGVAPKVAATNAPTIASSGNVATSNSRSDVPALEKKQPAAPISAGDRENITEYAAPARAAGAAPSGASAATPRAFSATSRDAAAEQAPVRVVGTPRVPGEKRTLYEVAPGDTVLLAEVLSMQLNEVVVTGVATAPIAQSRGKSAAVSAKAPATTKTAAAPDTQGVADAVSSAPAALAFVPAPSAETSNGVTTLTWTDLATGNTMKLSGRHSRVELEAIRRRIEQARAAAAAAAKKTP